ncbi:MAG: YhbY family RNA-binding protein [Betaproteobacteria bacterium]
MTAISPAERRALKARAHALDPVVLIGDGGVTEGVVAEIVRALTAHELIKVRAGGMAREARELAMAEICERTGAEPVQAIGKVMVLWKESPQKREREARRARAQAAPVRGPAPKTTRATRSARPGFRSSSPRQGSAPKPGRRRTSR